MSQNESDHALMDPKFMFKDKQRQFERRNEQFNEIRDRLDHNNEKVDQIQQSTFPQGRRGNRRPSIPLANHLDTHEGVLKL